MHIGFEVVAAVPKRVRAEQDQAVQQPMRPAPNQIRRNPSTDQKKVRHQQARKSAGSVAPFPPLWTLAGPIEGEECTACGGSGEQGNGHECYICDSTGLRSEERSGRAAGVTNDNPANDLPKGIDKGAAAKVHCTTCDEDYFSDGPEEMHEHSKTAGPVKDMAKGVGKHFLMNNPLWNIENERVPLTLPYDKSGTETTAEPIQPEHRDAQDRRRESPSVKGNPHGTHPAPGTEEFVPNPFEEQRREREPEHVQTEPLNPEPTHNRDHQSPRGVPFDIQGYRRRLDAALRAQGGQVNVRADALLPGNMVLTPTGQTVMVNGVRPHETNQGYVYVDTDQGSTAVQRNSPFTMVPGLNSGQQESPGYGTPGGNFHGQPMSGQGPHHQEQGSNVASGDTCPSCGRATLSQAGGGTYRCSNCGYSGSFGGAGGFGYGNSPSIRNLSRKDTMDDKKASAVPLPQAKAGECRMCGGDLKVDHIDHQNSTVQASCEDCGVEHQLQNRHGQKTATLEQGTMWVPTLRIESRYTAHHNGMSAIARRAQSVLATTEEIL